MCINNKARSSAVESCGTKFQFSSPCDDDVDSKNACCGQPRMWSVTFISNSGDIAALGIRYSVTNAIRTETDVDGKFPSPELFWVEVKGCGAGATCVLDEWSFESLSFTGSTTVDDVVTLAGGTDTTLSTLLAVGDFVYEMDVAATVNAAGTNGAGTTMWTSASIVASGTITSINSAGTEMVLEKKTGTFSTDVTDKLAAHYGPSDVNTKINAELAKPGVSELEACRAGAIVASEEELATATGTVSSSVKQATDTFYLALLAHGDGTENAGLDMVKNVLKVAAKAGVDPLASMIGQLPVYDEFKSQVENAADPGNGAMLAGYYTLMVGGSDTPLVIGTTGVKGTQENDVCSNRGLCDYDSGLCKCFNGFTDEDCSVQNALAMY